MQFPSSTERYETDNMGLGDKQRRAEVLNLSLWNATKYSIALTALASVGTYVAAMKNKNFSKFTSTSIKLAIPTMTFIGSFSFVYETTMTSAMLHPEQYGIGGALTPHVKKSNIPAMHRFYNYVYDHPFQMVSALGIPLAATIGYQQSGNTHLTFSQKVMHSRVFAQGGVLTILLITMAFREFMDRNGRFKEHLEGDDVKPEK